MDGESGTNIDSRGTAQARLHRPPEPTDGTLGASARATRLLPYGCPYRDRRTRRRTVRGIPRHVAATGGMFSAIKASDVGRHAARGDRGRRDDPGYSPLSNAASFARSSGERDSTREERSDGWASCPWDGPSAAG